MKRTYYATVYKKGKAKNVFTIAENEEEAREQIKEKIGPKKKITMEWENSGAPIREIDPETKKAREVRKLETD